MTAHQIIKRLLWNIVSLTQVFAPEFNSPHALVRYVDDTECPNAGLVPVRGHAVKVGHRRPFRSGSWAVPLLLVCCGLRRPQHSIGAARLFFAVFAFVVCASAAHADGFYVEGSLAALDHPTARAPHVFDGLYLRRKTNSGAASYAPTTVTVDNPRTLDISDVRNPYGALAFGYDIKWRAIVIDLQLLHQSSLATNEDRGQNSVRLSVRWYPFSRN